MPLSRSLQVAFILFFAIPLWAQRSAPPQGAATGEMPTPTRDAQAITVLNRAITAAGGLEKLGAVRDYRANGTVTRHEQAREIQGLITISGSGVAQLKVEENLSTGNRVETIDSSRSAVKNENGIDRGTRGVPFLPGNFALPARQLVTLLKDTNLDVTYKGLVQLDGTSVHQIHAQRLMLPLLDQKGRLGEQFGKDFFINAATFQVVMIQDFVPPSTPRRTKYSDYKQLNGILVPYSIDEEPSGKPSRTIRFDNITINPGLRKEDFSLSAR